jgi:hypothetical protein
MSGFGAVLIYLAVVAVILAVYKSVKRRQARAKPRLGDADAYEGNLTTPQAGEHGHPATAGTVSGGGRAARDTRPSAYMRNADHIPPSVLGGGRR